MTLEQNQRPWILSLDKLQYARQLFKLKSLQELELNDNFFVSFGPGNTTESSNRPFERFSDYELLLTILEQDDPQKYKLIHKGVPYYFLAWTAFDLGNYEKALFYMDAAIAEDIRRSPNSWRNTPSSSFLILDNSTFQVGKRVFSILLNNIIEELDRFNRVNTVPGMGITLSDFTDNFVEALISSAPNHRSIVTAFYSYTLEFKARYAELKLRSTSGGTMEPFLAHLFKGGLIFESLLKYFYNTVAVNTLGGIFGDGQFLRDFPAKPNTSSTSLKMVVSQANGNDWLTAFSTIARLRNTTGHNLVWDDVFNDPTNYKTCVEQQINAILYLIAVKSLGFAV